MSNKTSKITKCKSSGDWKSPAGTTIYYHEIEFENGDKGNCGRNKENPSDMQVGCEIEYSITDTKIKFVKAIVQMEEKKAYSNNRVTGNGGGKKNPQEFLGYCYAYAKDLVVAGKTAPEDVADLKRIAETIYLHVTSMLEGKFEEQGKEKENEPPPF